MFSDVVTRLQRGDGPEINLRVKAATLPTFDRSLKSEE
jgi:hypothetical protein